MPDEHGTLMDAFVRCEQMLRGICEQSYRLGYDDTEELIQLTRITAQRLDARGFKPQKAPPLLRTILQRHFLMYRRTRRNSCGLAAALDARAAGDISNDVDSRESLRSVLFAVSRLRGLLRDTVIARCILELSESETATLLSTNVSVVSTRLLRARQELLLFPPHPAAAPSRRTQPPHPAAA